MPAPAVGTDPVSVARDPVGGGPPATRHADGNGAAARAKPRQQLPAAAVRTQISLDALTGGVTAAAAQPTCSSPLPSRQQGNAAAAAHRQVRPAAAKQTAFSVVHIAAAGSPVSGAGVRAATHPSCSDAMKPPSRPALRGDRPPNKLIAEAVQSRLAEEAAAEERKARLAAVKEAAAAARRRCSAAMTPRKRPAPSSTAVSTAASSPVPSPPQIRVQRGGSLDTARDADTDNGWGPNAPPDASGTAFFGIKTSDGPDSESAEDDGAAGEECHAAAGARAEAKPDAAVRSHAQTPMRAQPDGLRTPVRRPLRPVEMAAAAGSALLRHAIEGPMLHRQQGPTPEESPAAKAGAPLTLPPWTPAGELVSAAGFLFGIAA